MRLLTVTETHGRYHSKLEFQDGTGRGSQSPRQLDNTKPLILM
jgi:hypothetical protein